MTDKTLSDLNKRLSPARKLLKEARKTNQVTDNIYHQTLVRFAYEYAIAGYVDETLSVILEVKPSYFLKDAIQHMNAEPKFKEQAEAVAEVIISAGMFPTQKVARA